MIPSGTLRNWSSSFFGEIVEPTLINPTFVYDYPLSAQPLARQHRSEAGLIEAWDLIIGGMERGTAFSELIDPVIQRERLTEQSSWQPAAMTKLCSWTKASYALLNTEHPLWVAWDWASTAS